MGRYLLKRLWMTALVVLLVTTALAGIVHVIPGDPVDLMLGPRASDELAARVRAEMGLDAPILKQVLDFLVGALQGDLGRDFVSNRPVTAMVASALPHTVILALTSLLMAATGGILLGVYAATHPNTWTDRVASLVSVSFVTMPSYVGGLFLLLVFAVQLGWLPAVGAGDMSNPAEYARHLVLPATALALTWIGYLARLVRASLLETLGANYVRVARAYGLSERLILYRYALKNALVPTVAMLGVALGNLVGGSVFVEVIFSRPGLGRLVFEAIGTRNFPVVRGGVLVVAVLFVVANLLADLSYRWLDPRIRVEQQRVTS
jgi:peptide/nickel transport system permease protein